MEDKLTMMNEDCFSPSSLLLTYSYTRQLLPSNRINFLSFYFEKVPSLPKSQLQSCGILSFCANSVKLLPGILVMAFLSILCKSETISLSEGIRNSPNIQLDRFGRDFDDVFGKEVIKCMHKPRCDVTIIHRGSLLAIYVNEHSMLRRAAKIFLFR